MINSIIDSISIALNAEFGDRYKNYKEEKKQDLEEPCFFILVFESNTKIIFEQAIF